MSANLPIDFERVEALIRGMDAKARGALQEQLQTVLQAGWLPQPGPQTEAFYCEADETLYGGAAGGGKTDLIVGLATTAHRRTLIFRAESGDLDGIWDRLTAVLDTRLASNNTVKRVIRTTDGRTVEGGHLSKPGSEKHWQGRPHDLIAFDEAAQLAEARVVFVLQWLRSTTPGQRQRALFATNPPLPTDVDSAGAPTSQGDWLLSWFAPWLDPLHPKPAAPGELRWCFMRVSGGLYQTVWVDGPGAYHIEEGRPATDDELAQGEVWLGENGFAVAKSRTFIPSRLRDNVYLKGTGYAERLMATPEPMRSMLLNGDFTIKADDDPWQVIPTAWVIAAQERFNARQAEIERNRPRQLVLFGDVAQGGADRSTLASLCEGDYFEPVHSRPGRETPDGPAVALGVLALRRDNSLIGLDGTGGWAGDAYRTLERDNGVEAVLLVASTKTGEWNPEMTLQYANLRAEMWWKFRLALDPKSEFRIALPPGARLRAQLTAPHFFVRKKELLIESKEDIRKRLAGASTDDADAVIGAWYLKPLAEHRLASPDGDGGFSPSWYRKRAEEPYDPLGEWG